MRVIPWSRRLVPRHAWTRLRGLPARGSLAALGDHRWRTSRLYRLLVLGMALLLVSMVSAAVTMEIAIRNAEVAVPSFKGLPAGEATRRATALGLVLNVEGHLYSGDVAAGRIISQTPAPGAVVRREWRVRVTESLGPPRAAVPDVTGESERDAVIALRRLGLDAGSPSRVPDASAPPGTVLAQSPGPGGPQSPTVSLLVSEAPPPHPQPAFVMPDLSGVPIAAARAAISSAGLKLAPVVYAPAVPRAAGTAAVAAAAPGTVTGQSPPAGYRVDPSVAIELTVAR